MKTSILPLRIAGLFITILHVVIISNEKLLIRLLFCFFSRLAAGDWPVLFHSDRISPKKLHSFEKNISCNILRKAWPEITGS